MPFTSAARAILLCSLLAAPVPAQTDAPTTRVVVRAVARDAKILYDAVGGARITITNTATGAVLAEGVQQGGSGDTERIMSGRRSRAVVFDTPGAAAFRAQLPLTEPTVVTITAEGPLRPAHATVRASKTMLVLPGQHVEGDGVVLELHGLILNTTMTPATEPGLAVRLTANVEMLCGCVVTRGGTWDADSMTVHAIVRRGDTVVSSTTLGYARPNTFTGSLPGLTAGLHR